MAIILQFYPNGEFTQGVDTVSKRKSRPERVSDKMLASDRAPQTISALNAEMNAEMYKPMYAEGTEFISAMGSTWTYLCKYDRRYHWAIDNHIDEPWETSTDEPPERLIGRGDLIAPIGSSNARIFTETKTSRKKCLRMTSSMGRNIRNAAYLLEQEYGKDNLSFLTLTLPDLPREGLEACSANWGRMVDQFLKWLRSKAEVAGIPLEYVYCTEIQEKRLEKYGEFALHLHLLFRGKSGKRKPWLVTPKQCRKAWARCIKSVYSGLFEERALENLQRVRRSAAAYLGKYLSKRRGDSNHASGTETTGASFRGHWGGMCHKLSRDIRRLKVRLGGCVGDWRLAAGISRGLYRGALSGHVRYFREGIIYTGRSTQEGVPMGFRVGVGCLSLTIKDGGLTNLLEYVYAHSHEWYDEL